MPFPAHLPAAHNSLSRSHPSPARPPAAPAAHSRDGLPGRFFLPVPRWLRCRLFPTAPSTKGPFPAPPALQGRVPHPARLPPARSPGRSAGPAHKCPSALAGSSGEAAGTRPPRDPAGSPRSAPSAAGWGRWGGTLLPFRLSPPATPSGAVPEPPRRWGWGNTPRGAGTPGPLAHRRSPLAPLPPRLLRRH